MNTTISLPAVSLLVALRALFAAIGRDATRPNLSSLYLTGRDGCLTLDATDGYRAHRMVLDLPNAPAVSWAWSRPTIEALVAMLASATKGRAKGAIVELHAAEARVDAVRMSLEQVAGLAPPFDQVIPKYDHADDARHAAPSVGLNPAYLADACEAAGRIVGQSGLLCMVGDTNLDPIKIEARGCAGSVPAHFIATVMPMRV